MLIGVLSVCTRYFKWAPVQFFDIAATDIFIRKLQGVQRTLDIMII